MIEIKDLTKAYNDILAIDKISLSINKGEIFGFVGPNGAGKSTTIKVLLNYVLADSGTAKILTYDILKQSKEIKKHVAYVSSEVKLYPELTGLEIINIAQDLHGIKNTKEINRLINLFSVEKNKKIKNMSLGNKKKVAIVSALALNSKILMLDEPTSGLDPLMQNILFKELKNMKKQGKTIFISSHNLKEVQDHCDRVAFIRNGQIIDLMSLSEKLKEGKFIKFKGDIKALEVLKKVVLSQNDDEISFIYTDNISKLIKLLSQIKVKNINIEDLSLEHQFLDYYKNKE